MATTIDIVMFTVPLLMAVIFTFITLAPKGKEKPSNIFSNTMITFMASMLASICWFIFGLTWPAIATTPMFVSIGYLWYAIGIIFTVLTLVTGLKMLNATFNTDQPRLVIKEDNEEE